MRLTAIGVALAACAFAACGGDDGGGGGLTDGGNQADAAGAVAEVTCPSTPDATVTTTNMVDAYMPMATTISVNGVVKFVMASSHNVTPNTITTTDPAISVNFGQTKCLRFAQAGTYGFYCMPHGFSGTITVQ